MMRWSSTMEVGDADFDRDHRQLIALVNLLADALLLGDFAQAESLAADLARKAERHCLREEDRLAAAPGMTHVIDAHRRVDDIAAAVRLAVEAGNLELAGRLLSTLEYSLGQAVHAERKIFTTAVH